MTVLYTRWRFENYKKCEKNHEKIRETRLHLGNIELKSFHFDEIFQRKFQIFTIPILALFQTIDDI